jgi:hypothetical protein
MQEFEEYLKSKKIDTAAFKEQAPEMWQEWLHLFQEVHPNSFTQQKLFLINPVRRKYPLKGEPASEKPNPAKVKAKPKFKITPRPKK